MIIFKPAPEQGIRFAWLPVGTPEGVVWLEWVHFQWSGNEFAGYHYARYVPERDYAQGVRAEMDCHECEANGRCARHPPEPRGFGAAARRMVKARNEAARAQADLTGQAWRERKGYPIRTPDDYATAHVKAVIAEEHRLAEENIARLLQEPMLAEEDPGSVAYDPNFKRAASAHVDKVLEDTDAREPFPRMTAEAKRKADLRRSFSKCVYPKCSCMNIGGNVCPGARS